MQYIIQLLSHQNFVPNKWMPYTLEMENANLAKTQFVLILKGLHFGGQKHLNAVKPQKKYPGIRGEKL